MKIWKRGDKLTIADLNRFESSSNNNTNTSGNNVGSGGSTIVTFDIIDNDGEYSAENFSLDYNTILEKIENLQDVRLIGARHKGDDETMFEYFYLEQSDVFETGIEASFKTLNSTYELEIGLDDSEPTIELNRDNNH